MRRKVDEISACAFAPYRRKYRVCVRVKYLQTRYFALLLQGANSVFACVRKSGRKVEDYRVCDRRTQPYTTYRFCALRLTTVTGGSKAA